MAVCHTAVHTGGSDGALEDVVMVNRYARGKVQGACVIVLLR